MMRIILRKTILALLFCFPFSSYTIKAQDNVGIGTNTPSASAMLEILSSNKGLLVPRMNTVAMNTIASPSNSLLIYNTDSMCYYFYRQPTANWVSLCSPEFGNFDTLFANYVNIDSIFSTYISTDSLFAHYVNIDSLFATIITADSLFSHYASIDSIFSHVINTDSLFAHYSNIDSLFSHYIRTDSLFSNYAHIDSLIATQINVDSLFAHYGNFDSLLVNYLNAQHIDADSIFATFGSFDSLVINGTPIQSLIDSLVAANDNDSICSNATSNYITKFISPSEICNSIMYDNGTNVGINTTNPVISFQVNSTDAIGVPAGTTAQRPNTPPIGSTRFNTSTGVMEVYNGTCWQNINTPPIGATYIQWFNASDPNSIYPCTVWVSSDITSGEFIRATGGLSNVANLPLTGAVQTFATQDHTHNSSASAGNAGALTTSSNGSHNHGGTTSGVNSFNSSTWIPYDDNLNSDAGNSGFGTDNATTCGNGWNGYYTAGNFMGQQNQSCLDHNHVIIADGLHSHTVPDHSHSINVNVSTMSSGNIAAETRPTNVAVAFWRRIQ